MNPDLIIKAVTFIFGIIGAAKILYEISIGRKSQLREEYKFAKDFIVEVNSNQSMHPYVREKGYQALAGDSQLVAEEVEYLLSLQMPALALHDYVLGREYLEHLPYVEKLQIAFKGKYHKQWSRSWRKYVYIALYAVFFFLSFAPLFTKSLFKTPSDVLFSFIVCLAVFGPYAWFSLKGATRIYRAEKLVQRQEKHTQIILL